MRRLPVRTPSHSCLRTCATVLAIAQFLVSSYYALGPELLGSELSSICDSRRQPGFAKGDEEGDACSVFASMPATAVIHHP